MTIDDTSAFEMQCDEIAKAAQEYLDSPPGEEREALLLRMRALGLRSEHIAEFLRVVGEVQEQLHADPDKVLH